MEKHLRITGITLFVTVIAVLAARYFLPLLLPFVSGAALAICAEPITRLFERRFHLPRGVGAALGVSMVICFAALVIFLVGALAIRQIGVLTRIAPDLEETLTSGLAALALWLKDITAKTPAGLAKYLSESIDSLFTGGTALLDRAVKLLLSLAGGILRQVPDGALGIGTALISSYMIAAKLPRLREGFAKKIDSLGIRSLIPAVARIRKALGGWLLAQLKLSAITFGVLSVGFAVLRIPFAPIWAGATAIVDAFPILGTGTVLIPWSVICFLQGNTARGIGLLGLYALAALLRSMLEPKIIGKELGIDPLVTLLSLYVGYRLWGLIGMLLAPMTAAAIAAAGQWDGATEKSS